MEKVLEILENVRDIVTKEKDTTLFAEIKLRFI